MIKVNAYTTGSWAPSARYRVRQLIPYLKEEGVQLNEIISQSFAFPPKGKVNQLVWAFKNLSENGLKILNQPKANVTLLQKAMLSKHYTMERFLNKPLIFDVDDAIFLDNGGSFAQKIAKKSTKIICGNNYLANYFSKYNPNIDIIPTAVEVAKYDAVIKTANKNFITILWSGTSSGFPYLYKIEHVLKQILSKYDFVKLKIVSNNKPTFSILQLSDYEFEFWTEENEFSSMVNADIGIMPLNDDEFSKGKCSYKMLCYMASKLPVVVSPFGMNQEVLNLAPLGFGATTDEQWFEAIESIIISESLRQELAINGYKTVQKYFDASIIAKQITQSFKSVL